MTFLRRAVQDDKNLQIVTLQRLAKDQFRRFSVDDSLDLVAGFPKTRDELFAYKGIILGSMEASYFTGDQLRMLADFVERARRRVARVRRPPLRSARADLRARRWPRCCRSISAAGRMTKTAYFSELKVDVTVPGSIHAATQIAEAESTSAKRWKTMPPVTSVNRVGRREAGRDGAADGTPTQRRRQRDRARVSAVWSRQGDRVPDSGLVALADGCVGRPSTT